MRSKKKWIIIATVVLIAVVIGVMQFMAAAKNKVKEVDVETLQAKNLAQTISVTGNVDARDKEDIILSTQQKVKKLFVTEGQEVKANDILLTVDTTDLEYQLRKYRLNLELSNMNLNRLMKKDVKSDKKSLENAVKQAEINLNSAANDFADANRKFQQNKTLFETGAISKEEYDASEKRMKELKNQMELSEIQLSNAENTLADFDTSREDQIADQRNQIESAKADISNAQSKIAQSSIKATINGKIVNLDIKENQYPTPENSIISIYDLSLYKVAVEVSQYDAVSIIPGQKASIKVKGLDKEYTGTIVKIDEAATIRIEGANKEAKVGIEITVDNPDDRIKAGYEADIDITLKESPNTLAVNFEALKDDNGKKYVFVIENGKAVKKYVKTGIETDFDVQIIEGLKAGDQYIKTPPEGLTDGAPVKAKEVKNDNKN